MRRAGCCQTNIDAVLAIHTVYMWLSNVYSSQLARLLQNYLFNSVKQSAYLKSTQK